MSCLDCLGLVIVVGQGLNRCDVLDRLVTELEVLLEGDGILDLEPDDRACNE